MKYLCIDIGGTFMKYCVLEDGELSAEVQKKAVPQEKLEDLLDMIRSIYDEVIKEHTVDGVAISMPGVIETDKGYMRSGGSLQYIQEIPLADIISRRCGGIPVNIENDAKAAATAELATGALRNYSNAVLLTIGTAIGGAVIVEKTILRGWNLCAGEFSYMLYQEKAPRSFWGMHGVPRRMVTLYGDETVTSEQIIERMQAEDKKASELFIRLPMSLLCSFMICSACWTRRSSQLAVESGHSQDSLKLSMKNIKSLLRLCPGSPKRKLSRANIAIMRI